MQHDGKKGLNVQDQRLVELVRQFQKGDSGAFDKIFSLAYSNVYFMVYKMMRDHYEAEDVTQEVFTNKNKNCGNPLFFRGFRFSCY